MRCYNGAWDSEAQALFKEQDRLMREIKKYEPEAHCTYHAPHTDPGGWRVSVWGREIGPFRDTKLGALQSSLKRLRQLSEESV